MPDPAKQAAAEAALKELEAPKQRHAHARHDLETLRNGPVPAGQKLQAMHAEMVKAAEQEMTEAATAYAAHKAKHEGDGPEGALQRKIDQAAQDVLDAEGEAHTDQAFIGGADHAG